MSYGFHPHAGIFPLLDGEEFRALVEDIRANGQLDAIVLHDGLILDGRNRYTACLAAGVEPRFTDYDGDDPLKFVLSANLHRRHLTDDQRAVVAARIANMPRGRPSNNPPSGGFSQPTAAKILSVPHRAVERAAVVLNHGVPELIESVDAGNGIALASAAALARKPAEHQRRVVDLVTTGQARDVKDAERQVVTGRRQQEAEERVAAASSSAPHPFAPDIVHADVLAGLAGIETDTVDLVVADPPYNIGKAEWDKRPPADHLLWCAEWLRECVRILKPTGSLYVFGYPRGLTALLPMIETGGLVYRDWIVWDTIMGTGGGLWVNRHEDILYFSKSRDTFEDADAIKLERHEENIREYRGVEYRFKNPSNIWRFPRIDDSAAERTNHPTQKPLALIERIVRASSPAGGLVVDPFVGSGTTCVAAMRQQRRSIGIDNDPDNITIARARIASEAVA